jgi:hypothetical protein
VLKEKESCITLRSSQRSHRTSRSNRRENKKIILHVLVARRNDMRRKHVGTSIHRGYQRNSRTRVNIRPKL